MHTYKYTYIKMYIHTYMHTYKCTYIQMYIHEPTMHTYYTHTVHTYIHIYKNKNHVYIIATYLHTRKYFHS